MKIFVYYLLMCIIWVLQHSYIKFECKNQFCKYLKNYPKIQVRPNFRTFLKIFAKLIFALKFNITVCQHPNNMHKNFHKVYITGQKIPQSGICPAPCGLRQCARCFRLSFYQRLSSVKGCLPSKGVFCQRSSSVKGRLPSKVVFC